MSGKDGKPLSGGYIQNTIGNISQSFRLAGRADPRLDDQGLTYLTLSNLFRSYKNEDPPPQHEKAIPLSLLSFLRSSVSSPLDKETVPLLIVALFFCMRSCEYLKTRKCKNKRTKIVTLGGVRFFADGKVLSFFDPNLHQADSVSITFADQKNATKLQSVHVERAAVDDPRLCCVYNLAKTCRRIASYSHHTPILYRELCMYKTTEGNFVDINPSYVIKLLRMGARAMGAVKLGFEPEEIGTHSIRSGGAMAYYLLPSMSDSQVMFFGRWKSLAFLRYIRSQVDRFHSGWSTQIVLNPHFRNIPSLNPAQARLLSDNRPDYLLYGGDTANHDPRTRACSGAAVRASASE